MLSKKSIGFHEAHTEESIKFIFLVFKLQCFTSPTIFQSYYLCIDFFFSSYCKYYIVSWGNWPTNAVVCSKGVNLRIIVCRNILFGKTYYNFCFSGIILYCFIYTLIIFSKQIPNTFAKIINGYKGKFNTLWNSFWRKLLLAPEANSESCQTSKIELF